jgi:hypothetical protein
MDSNPGENPVAGQIQQQIKSKSINPAAKTTATLWLGIRQPGCSYAAMQLDQNPTNNLHGSLPRLQLKHQNTKTEGNPIGNPSR